MGQRREQYDHDTVGPERLAKSFRQNRYFLETFMTEPFSTVKGANAAPGGTSGESVLVFTGRYTFEYYFVGGASDGAYPLLASDGGYDWKFDADTVAEGIEINFGSLKTGHPRTYVSTEDFFFRGRISADDASGVDAFVGFRRVAAYAQTLTEYSDVFGIRILGNSASTDAAFTAVTNLNNAGATDYTSTNLNRAGLEDATAVECEIRCKGRAGEFYINGVRFREGTFTPDSGDYFTPVIRFLHTTDLAGPIKTLCVEGGLLKDRSKQLLKDLSEATA